jgi:uncharacterized protein YlaI
VAKAAAKAKARAAAKATAKARAGPVVILPLAPAPLGRPSAPSWNVLAVGDWYACLFASVRQAREVMVASCLFDHRQLTDLFVQRLRDSRPFELSLIVDKEGFDERTCYHQRARLRALRNAGAHIWICRGCHSRGRMHMKAVVVDRRLNFSGGLNLTDKSMSNEELCYRMHGEQVAAVVHQFAEVRIRGQLWDGA